MKQLIAARGLKQPDGRSHPMRVTQAMCHATPRTIPGGMAPGGETVTFDSDGDECFERWPVSSPEYTAAYVARYCKLNNLKQP